MPSFPATWLLLVAAFAVCLAGLRLAGGPRSRGAGFRAADYRAKRLLTPWELRGLAEIKLELPGGYHACPQVRLADLVEVAERDPARRRAALNRVASKSVDFAIVDHAGAAVLVVELDDRSHDRPDRRLRDQQVNEVLAHCRIPLVRIKPGQRVDVGRHLAVLRQQAAE